MDQTVVFSVISATWAISGIVFAYIGYSKGSKKDSYSEGTERGTLRSDITYIMKRSDDMLLEQRDTNKNLNALAERVTRCEESTKSAHKRIDTLEEKEKDKGQGHD